MKMQLSKRLGVAHVRDTVMQLVTGEIEFAQAMAELQVGKTRLYELKASFLAARAAGAADSWVPGTSGGDHAAPWPEEEQRFLRRVLSPCGETKRYSYAFAASELGRLFGHSVDRGQVRHWAIDHGIKIAVPKPRPPAHVRRWQRRAVGELWQLDATPDRFLGGDGPVYQLLDMLDDCSRVQVGCRLYARECVPSYLDLFYGAFSRYGLPLEIYVDKAGFFRGENGELTQLGRRLKFFDISFVFANSPESKGKIERVHLVWQDRLPAYFGREGIGPDTPIQTLNEHVASLVDHRNGFEVHREIGMTPDAAWDMAVREGALQAQAGSAGRVVGARLVRMVARDGRAARARAARRAVLPDGMRQRHEGVALPAHRRHGVRRAQQARARSAPGHPLQQQPEGSQVVTL